MDFASLPSHEQEAVREKQRLRKLAKKEAQLAQQQCTVGAEQSEIGGEAGKAAIKVPKHSLPTEACPTSKHPASITRDEYFAACRGGLFRDPHLPPTEQSLELLLSVLTAGDEQARRLNTCNYFQFSGPDAALWDPVLNARLAYEGFFTITMSRRGTSEPLPELQPFYGVLIWPNFEGSKHVRKAVARLRRSKRRYWIASGLDPRRTWRLLDRYHRKHYGSNWLTEQYFNMLQMASRDPSINFQMQCIELYAEELENVEISTDESPPQAGSCLCPKRLFGSGENTDGGQPHPLAGEIGFTVGGIYTSLSGWTEERNSDGLGFAQLVLLGRWLQRKGYAFWSLGHCYSPEMDYKRELGHRVFLRTDFLALLKEHRGHFRLGASASGASEAQQVVLNEGERCDAQQLLESQ